MIRYSISMKPEYIFWEEEGHFLGYLREYSDYWTQGETLEDLKEHLLDLHKELNSGAVSGVRRIGELEVA